MLLLVQRFLRSSTMRAFSFFSSYEWWYHVTMMPFLLAAGNYYFIGERYFYEANIFWIGTGLVFLLYWFSIVTLTLLVRWIIARFPERDETTRRLVIMLASVALMTVLLAIFDVWVYSLFSVLEVAFVWEKIWPIIILGFLFDVLLCAALGLFYTFDKWKQNQADAEKLERRALQLQFNELKARVNPHFLFNSLNSLSALIEEDQKAAEGFVDGLSVVYRYILQASRSDLVSITEEIGFLRTYAKLLEVRYDKALVIGIPDILPETNSFLPPLTLQILLDNAVRFNQTSLSRPLFFDIEIRPGGEILVKNNIQLKTRLTAEKASGLGTLKSRYAHLSDNDLKAVAADGVFSVMLPYLGECR